MDKGEEAHWRRVRGSRGIWFVDQTPLASDRGRAWALSRWRAVAGIGAALRGLLARFARPRVGRRVRRGRTVPPRRRHRT